MITAKEIKAYLVATAICAAFWTYYAAPKPWPVIQVFADAWNRLLT